MGTRGHNCVRTDDLGLALLDYERDLKRIAASLIPVVAGIGTTEAIDAIQELARGGDEDPGTNPIWTGRDLETQERRFIYVA